MRTYDGHERERMPDGTWIGRDGCPVDTGPVRYYDDGRLRIWPITREIRAQDEECEEEEQEEET